MRNDRFQTFIYRLTENYNRVYNVKVQQVM